MEEVVTGASLKALLRFPFRGADGQSRFVIGTLLVLAGFVVPIVPGVFLLGYVLRVMRRAIRGQELALPEWDDWGRMGLDGLRAMVVTLAYLLPGLVALFGGMGIYFASVFILPLSMAVLGEGSGVEVLFPLMLLGSMAIMFLSMFLGTLILVLGGALLPVATAHFCVQDEVAAAFRLRQWWPMLRVNALGYFVAWVILAGLMAMVYLGVILAYSTLILCCLIPLLLAPVGFYLWLVGAAVFGGTYRESTALLATAEA
jgi:hypothetical protein